MLLEAMDHSQSRKKKMEETPDAISNKKLETITSGQVAESSGPSNGAH